jgi:hypothetical protein
VYVFVRRFTARQLAHAAKAAIGQRFAHRLQVALRGVHGATRAGGVGVGGSSVFAIEFAQVLACPGVQVRQDSLGQHGVDLLPQRVACSSSSRSINAAILAGCMPTISLRTRLSRLGQRRDDAFAVDVALAGVVVFVFWQPPTTAAAR